MSEHQDPEISMTVQNQQTTLEQRRKFWINMNLNAFDELCIRQKLLSRGAKGSTNQCYDEAVVMYKRVHDPEYGPRRFVEGYLKHLEELRDANVVVSADMFLEGQKLGLVASPDQSYLAEFLDFTRDKAWTGFNKLVPAVERFRAAAQKYVLENDGASFDRSLTEATRPGPPGEADHVDI